MAERQYRLTAGQVNELIAAYTETTDGPTRTRLLAVRLYGTGYAVAEISDITRCSRTSLMEWCQKYLAHGPGGLADHRLGGNSRKLTPAQVADLKERLQQYSPRTVFGSDTATAEGRFWTIEDLQQAIQHWYGVTYQSRTSCWTLFARCGFSYQRPARVFKSRREADVAAFEETLEKNSLTSHRRPRTP
jgi:transposase